MFRTQMHVHGPFDPQFYSGGPTELPVEEWPFDLVGPSPDVLVFSLSMVYSKAFNLFVVV